MSPVMVSDPGPGVGDEQVHLDDPDLQPVQLRQVRPVRQDPEHGQLTVGRAADQGFRHPTKCLRHSRSMRAYPLIPGHLDLGEHCVVHLNRKAQMVDPTIEDL